MINKFLRTIISSAALMLILGTVDATAEKGEYKSKVCPKGCHQFKRCKFIHYGPASIEGPDGTPIEYPAHFYFFGVHDKVMLVPCSRQACHDPQCKDKFAQYYAS